MRVVHVMASGERGGGADHLTGLLPELRRVGVECIAAVGAHGPLGDRLERAGFQVSRLDLMRSRVDPQVVLDLRAGLLRLEPDLVHCHGTRAAFMVMLGKIHGPWIYTVHGLSYRQSGSSLRRGLRLAAETAACRRAAEVLSVSAIDLEDLRRRGALQTGRGVHIPNAVDIERFRPRDRVFARSRLGIPDDAFVVGTVARLVRQKGVADLVSAASLLRGVTLVIVGDGPLRGALETMAVSAGANTVFLGSRDDVEEVLPAFDVFVLPSLWEGEPISLLEAMAAGIPCVATATSGSREILSKPGRGVMVPLHDPHAIAVALETLRSDASRRVSMVAAARAAVEQRSWGAAAALLLPVYEEVLARHG
jgi:glycosyltransferase involved in cell wall biosynthesis